MKRVLVAGGAAIGVVAAGYVGTAAWIGSRVPETLRQQIQAADEQTPRAALSVARVDSGIFRSTARITAEPRAGDRSPVPDLDTPLAARIPVTIAHGPILLHDNATTGLAAVRGEARLTAETREALENPDDESKRWAMPGEGAFAELTGAIRFDGSFAGTVTTPDYTGPVVENTRTGEAVKLAWSDFRADLHLPAGTSAVRKVDARVGQAAVEAPDEGGFALEDVTALTELRPGEHGLWYGEVSLSAGTARLVGEAQDGEIVVADAALDYSLRDDGGDGLTWKATADAGGTEMRAPDGENRRLALDGASIEMALTSLAPSAFADLAELAQQPGQPAPGEVRPLLRELVRGGPELEVTEISATTPDGHVHIAGNAGFGEKPPKRLDPRRLRRALRASVSARVDTALLTSLAESSANSDRAAMRRKRQVQRVAAQLQRQGLISEADGRLESEASYREGRLRINGERADRLLRGILR